MVSTELHKCHNCLPKSVQQILPCQSHANLAGGLHGNSTVHVLPTRQHASTASPLQMTCVLLALADVHRPPPLHAFIRRKPTAEEGAGSLSRTVPGSVLREGPTHP